MAKCSGAGAWRSAHALLQHMQLCGITWHCGVAAGWQLVIRCVTALAWRSAHNTLAYGNAYASNSAVREALAPSVCL